MSTDFDLVELAKRGPVHFMGIGGAGMSPLAEMALLAGNRRSATVTARELAQLMVGSELPVPELRESTVTEEPVLRLEDGRLVPSTQARPW